LSRLAHCLGDDHLFGVLQRDSALRDTIQSFIQTQPRYMHLRLSGAIEHLGAVEEVAHND
jgi:hypothetical protein